MDGKTAKSLACLCKGTEKTLKEDEVWLTRFNLNYGNKQYLSWWSPYENYKLRKLGGKMSILVNHDHVDFVLYKWSPIRNRLLHINDDAIHSGIGYRSYESVEVDFNRKAEEYILVREAYIDSSFTVFFVGSKDEARRLIQEEIEIIPEDEYTRFYLVKLSSLVLDFSFTKETPCRKDYFLDLYCENSTKEEEIEKFLVNLS